MSRCAEKKDGVRWAKVVLACGWLALCLGAGRITNASEPEQSLTGQLLVATQETGDPRFAESVIYLVRHDGQGALGLIINRPLAKGPIGDLLKGFGVEIENPQGEIIVHYGGPVSTLQGFLLHSDDVLLENSTKARDGIAMTSDTKLLEAMAHGKGPRQALFMLGYAGWAPGQLEAEIKADSWFTIPGDRALIFGEDAERKWKLASERRRIPL
jgi:putative transcriptional regulator